MEVRDPAVYLDDWLSKHGDLSLEHNTHVTSQAA